MSAHGVQHQPLRAMLRWDGPCGRQRNVDVRNETHDATSIFWAKRRSARQRQAKGFAAVKGFRMRHIARTHVHPCTG